LKESEIIRLPNDNILFVHLTDFIRNICAGPEWYIIFS